MGIHLGCPVWSFKGWVGNFYPKGTKPSEFLREYARRLTTIEGNTTFYAVPAQKTVEQWVAETPETFRFCPKIPKAISHEGKLMDHVDRAARIRRCDEGAWSTARTDVPAIAAPVLPETVRRSIGLSLRLGPDMRLAVEVRHLDWFEPPHDESLNRLLSDHNMARVTIDTRPIRDLAGDAVLAGSAYESLLEARERKPDIPVIPKRTADFVFVRYIGHPQMAVNSPLLGEWGIYFASQIQQGADVFAFCHSPDNLLAPDLCRELHRLVAHRMEIEPLPWDTLKPDVPEQPGLF